MFELRWEGGKCFYTSMCKNIIIFQLESNQKSTNFTKQVICGIDIVTNLSGMPLLWFKGFVGRRSAKRGYVGVWRVLPPQSNIRPVTHFAHNLVKKLLDPAECALRDPSFALFKLTFRPISLHNGFQPGRIIPLLLCQ